MKLINTTLLIIMLSSGGKRFALRLLIRGVMYISKIIGSVSFFSKKWSLRKD